MNTWNWTDQRKLGKQQRDRNETRRRLTQLRGTEQSSFLTAVMHNSFLFLSLLSSFLFIYFFEITRKFIML
jgi:hypothetical protein